VIGLASLVWIIGCTEPVRLGSDPSSDADADTDSETGSDTGADGDTDSDGDSDTDTGSDSGSDTGTDTGSDSDSGTETDTDTGTGDCTPRDRVAGGGGLFCPDGTSTCWPDGLCYDSAVCADCCGDPCR